MTPLSLYIITQKRSKNISSYNLESGHVTPWGCMSDQYSLILTSFGSNVEKDTASYHASHHKYIVRGSICMEYHALSIGLTDKLFPGIQSVLTSSILCLTPLLTVRDAGHLLDKQILQIC